MQSGAASRCPFDSRPRSRLALFPLLERLGDRYATLSTAAELTLSRICLSLGDAAVGSVPELLAANADFLLDALGRRLRHASRFPHTAAVVQAVLEFGGERALSIAFDVLDDVLRLVDLATPTAPPSTAASSRAQYLRYLTDDRAPLTAMAPAATALATPPRPMSAAELELLEWVHTLHVLALACRERLRLEHSSPPAAEGGGEGGGGEGGGGEGGGGEGGLVHGGSGAPRQRRVLVADDAVINRRLLRRAFEKYFDPPWHVSEATIAPEALTMLKTAAMCGQPFDLFIADENYEPADVTKGTEAILELRAYEAVHGLPRMPVILCSGNIDVAQDCSDGSIDLCWTKPFPKFADGTMQAAVMAVFDGV